MKLLKNIITTALFLILIVIDASAESNKLFEQTVRGKIIDQDSKTTIIGANIIILESDPILGASTDFDGNFRIENVPVGRVTIQISYLGYEKKVIPNIVVGSGKEVIMEIEIVESIIKLDDITIKGRKRKQEALNEMATVSAKVFTVEETKRYAGTFNDPARMVSAFAGVASNPTGNNDIIVRGNSPKGILWRLEGIDIPNPNHFANEGASGGPINALNSAMLANSDFFSGAFAPEYGNAYSGIFDMKLRTGNNEKREYSFSAGALGIDGTIEGPFKKGYGGSYLLNYRYSSLGVLDDLGIVDFMGVPKYQDISFKTTLPTKKAGSFSIFGLGGLSNIDQNEMDETNENYVLRTAYFEANLGVLGITHTYQLNDKTYLKSSVSFSSTQNNNVYKMRNNNDELYTASNSEFTNSSAKISTTVNSKINSQSRIKAGITYTNLHFNMFSENDYLGDGNYITELDSDGKAGLLQGYINWKYRLNNDVTLISGIHYMNFLMNNSTSIEPRLGMEYQINPKQSLSFGFGIHSNVETLSTYYAQVENNENNYSTPNKNLDLAKAMHFVLGFKQQFSKNLHLKTEVYYQNLTNVLVENDTESPFVLNNQTEGWINKDLVNEGLGRNYGLELTLERFYNNRFYFLATASLYDSKFTALDGVERNSTFNGNFTSNFLIGKEFPIGDESKNKSIAINAKITFAGGTRFTPIDLESSIAENKTVFEMDEYMENRGDNIFKADMSISYRRDRKKTTHELKFDVQNITNNQAVVYEYFDHSKNEIEQASQWTIFPNIIYTIQF